MATLTPDQVYKLAKTAESKFTIPTNTQVITVGTFDATKKTFSGKTTTVRREGLEPGDPRAKGGVRYVGDTLVRWHADGNTLITERIPSPIIDAVTPTLKYKFVNHVGKKILVKVNNSSFWLPTGKSELIIPLNHVEWIHWSIHLTSANSTPVVEDDLDIRYEHKYVAVGAFIIPAIPLILLYEPPCDRQRGSRASFSTTMAFSTAVGLEFSTESSRTKPVKPNGYKNTQTAKSTLNTLSSVMEKLPYLKDAAPFVKSLADGLGRIEAVETVGNIEAHETILTTTIKEGKTYYTGQNDGGPGVGDQIAYLEDIKMIWVAEDGELKLLTPIGWKFAQHSLNWIRKNEDIEVAQALLSIDPFSDAGANAQLPKDRFLQVEPPMDLSGMGANPGLSIILEHQVKSEDQTKSTSYKIHIEDYIPGWLSMFGLGVTQRETIKSTVTQSNSVKSTSERVDRATIDFSSDVDEGYKVELYYDRVYGTFACRSVN
ncbi:MAG: hypothetical protein C3F07_02190 [Anaerolineales bacterium]|nr:hypothetical protein [Anaerolineae bacterium]PWB77350.1 MAG: hypothetical protein C3F07_02190 [Anaerolineales bacterium]